MEAKELKESLNFAAKDIDTVLSWLVDKDKVTAFTSVNVPLHPGAAKYYDEAGIAIPDAIRP